MFKQPLNVSDRAEVSNLKDEHQEKKDELDQTLDMEMNTVWKNLCFGVVILLNHS